MFGKKQTAEEKAAVEAIYRDASTGLDVEQKMPGKRPLRGNQPREPQYYKTATNLMALNYRVYIMSMKEKVGYSLLAFAVGAAVGYIFYGGLATDDLGQPTILTYILNTIIMSVTGFVFARIFLPMRTEQLKKGRQEKLKTQFRDMLEAFSTSLGAGRNVKDSFSAAYDDLGNQYESTAFILQELFIINHGIINGQAVEDMLEDFGYRSGIEDISNFANVFKICYRRGGNIKDTVKSTCDIIGDKMSIMQTIETTVTSSKSELNLMLVLPVLMIMLMKGSSEDFARNFASPAGILSTTVALILTVVAYLIGKKVMDIKV